MEPMDEIYRNHAKTVYKYLLSQCRSEHLAEELTQETFYQAMKSIHRYDGTCKLSVWLCGIAKHLWYRYLEKHKREILKEDAGTDGFVASSEDLHLAKEGQVEIVKAIHRLKEPGREVVYLRLFGGLSYREIGEILGKSENWARVTFFRSKEQLKGGITNDEKPEL